MTNAASSLGAEGEASRDAPFRSVFTQALPSVLQDLSSSLVVTTYQSGRVILVRARDGVVNTHFRFLHTPMGVAVRPGAISIGTKRTIWELRDQPAVAAKIDPPGSHDACFLPRRAHVSGDIQVHELVHVDGQLWAANTRFSCLCTFDDDHSFVPRWRPPFVSALSADDRCHLNGIAVRDGAIRYVTALGMSDEPQGWRARKADGGAVLEVPSGDVVANGLSMPHSPRWYGGRLWVLNSGRGEVSVVDEGTGAVEAVAQLPGFTRGLTFAGPFAFVGLSQVRESVFGGIPLSQRLSEDERECGVWVLDIRSGATVAFLRFEGAVQEVFDVQVLPGVRWPDLVEPEDPRTEGAFILPDEALAEVAAPRPNTDYA